MENLKKLILGHAVSKGEVKLASGKMSNYYIDMSKVIMLHEGLKEIIESLFALDENLYWDEFDSIGGPAMGAIPLITEMMMESGIARSFFVRKESKDHGNQDIIEGNLRAGDRVLMLEDVVTSGGSLYRAIQAVEAADAKVTQIYAVVDREEGAADFFKEKGYPFKVVLPASELFK